MWGRLVDLASAAAEQVQKEAINIANDGFDLLDKLDSTMNNTEDEERIKNDASSELGDMEPSGEVIASVPKQLETFNAPLEIKKEDEASPVVLSIKSTPEQPKKSPVKKGTLSPLTKTASPPKPQPQPLETEDPAAQRALAELKSVLWCSPSASMQEVLVRVREVLDESGEQAQVIRGLSETLDARESAHRAEITELKEKLVQSNGRVSVLEAALDETEKRPQELAPSSISKIASLQSDLSSALDRVSALEAAAAESQSRWSREEAELLAKCAALESKREELARDLLAKESELQGVLEKLDGSNESITSLNTRIEALASELRSAEASHIAKEQEHARQLEVSAEANRTLTQKLADARKQQKSKVAAQNNNIDVINKLKAEMAEAVERVSMLERLKSEETASLQAQISALTEARAADERSIAELRLQMQEKSSALEALSSTPPPPPQEVTSEAPTTPVRPSNASQLTGSESPDDSSFKTPGPAPKSGVGKGKLRAKGKSKAEVTDEIKTLSSQLHSLKAMQASLSSDVKQSMALINQDLVSSIAASLVPQVPSISSSTGTTIEKPVESAIENLSEKSTEISQLEQRIGDYEQRIEALKVEKDGLVNSIASIEKELADANVRVEELTMSNANLQDSLGTSNATIADLRAAKESSEASSISKIATLTTSVETLTDNINGLRSDISVKDGEISELREKLSISEAEAVAKMKLEERNQALESKNEEFTARIFFLETLASEVTEKSSLVAALQKEIKALQDGAADLEMNQADLEQKLNDKSQHIQDLEANRALLEKELSELKRRQAEDLNIRYVETARLNEEITKNAEALHLERQKFQVLSEKCLDFERIASANSKLVDEGDKQIQTFKTEIGILHGKLAEAVETIERLKETNEFQQFEVSAKVKHIGDMESQLSKMKQALEESNAKLFSLQDDIARRVLEESAVRDQNEQLRNQLAGLMRERDENRKASELAELQASKLAKDLADLQKVVENTTLKWTTAEQQLEQMAKEAERKNAEMGQLTKRLHEMQEFSSSFSDLKAELDRANEKLSKQDEKKKRDLENLKKQNELIAKVNREKDELERNLNRTISDLNLQLQDLTSSKFTLELALKESETARAAAGVEIDELRMKLSLAGDSTILSTSADDNKVTCSECVALKEALDASNQALKKEGELHLVKIKSLEQENLSVRDQLSSRDRSVREVQGQLDEMKKERDALLVAQSASSGLGPQLLEVQGRNRELQMELDKASIRSKQQELALSDANASVIRLRMELSSVSKQLSDLKTADMNATLSPSVDLEAGSFASGDVTQRTPHGASSVSARSKGTGSHATTPLMLTADADDVKGKDDWDGVNPSLLQIWAFLRQRAPSLVPERPPSRKLVMLCAQLYLIALHGVAVLSISYIKHSCK